MQECRNWGGEIGGGWGEGCSREDAETRRKRELGWEIGDLRLENWGRGGNWGIGGIGGIGRLGEGEIRNAGMQELGRGDWRWMG